MASTIKIAGTSLRVAVGFKGRIPGEFLRPYLRRGPSDAKTVYRAVRIVASSDTRYVRSVVGLLIYSTLRTVVLLLSLVGCGQQL